MFKRGAVWLYIKRHMHYKKTIYILVIDLVKQKKYCTFAPIYGYNGQNYRIIESPL